MATVSAITHNPPIRAAYRRWRAAGKLPKVALVAAMHKLLIHLNAMLKHHTVWHPTTDGADGLTFNTVTTRALAWLARTLE